MTQSGRRHCRRAQIPGDPPDALAGADRQDTTQLADETRWRLFDLPLVATAGIRAAGWTGCLRHHHALALDALFAWSQKIPQNKAAFDRLFPLLRPAAGAEQATSLAIPELLYQSTSFLTPRLGAGTVDPVDDRRYRPRYPILASPQG